MNSSPRRIPAYDSLRFLAAAAVLLAHARAMLDWQWTGIGGRLADPNSAVVFFFVLSGYVLHRSWDGQRPTLRTWTGFVVRRWFRIMPLYYVAIVLAMLVATMLPLADCPWFHDPASGLTTLHRDHADWRQWLAHALLIDPTMDASWLNPPVWTLRIEMQMAMIFPWLSWLVARCDLKRAALLLAVTVGAAVVIARMGVENAHCVSMFLIGIILAIHGDRLKTNAPGAALLLVVGLCLYAWPSRLGMIDALHPTVVALGSAAIMAAIVALNPLRRLLETRALVVCGEASFGLYVLHFPVLMAVAYQVWKHGWWPLLLIIVGGGLAFGLAIILRALIERPMIERGRRITASLGCSTKS